MGCWIRSLGLDYNICNNYQFGLYGNGCPIALWNHCKEGCLFDGLACSSPNSFCSEYETSVFDDSNNSGNSTYLIVKMDKHFQALDIIGVVVLVLKVLEHYQLVNQDIWIYIIFFAGVNAVIYYIWDVVKSAYKQIKEENLNNCYPEAYPMNI